MCSALERCSSAIAHELAGREKVAMRHTRGPCAFTFFTRRIMRGRSGAAHGIVRSDHVRPIVSDPVADDEGNEKEQRMEFPNPAKPKEIDHGDADGGFNFPGSAGFIWQARSIMIAIHISSGPLASWRHIVMRMASQTSRAPPASSGRHASVPLPVSDCLAAASASRSRSAFSGRRSIRQVHSSVLEAVAAWCACLPTVRWSTIVAFRFHLES